VAEVEIEPVSMNQAVEMPCLEHISWFFEYKEESDSTMINVFMDPRIDYKVS